jgi:hypothetical protein
MAGQFGPFGFFGVAVTPRRARLTPAAATSPRAAPDAAFEG